MFAITILSISLAASASAGDTTVSAGASLGVEGIIKETVSLGVDEVVLSPLLALDALVPVGESPLVKPAWEMNGR